MFDSHEPDSLDSLATGIPGRVPSDAGVIDLVATNQNDMALVGYLPTEMLSFQWLEPLSGPIDSLVTNDHVLHQINPVDSSGFLDSHDASQADGHDTITGEKDRRIVRDWVDVPGEKEKKFQVVINKGETSPEEKKEVDNLLAKETLNRGQDSNSIITTDHNAGGKMEESKELGGIAFRDKTVVNGSLGKNDGYRDPTTSSDFFKFTAVKQGQYLIKADNFKHDTNIQIYNRNGELVQSSLNKGESIESLKVQLQKGDYFVRAFTAEGAADTSYRLTIEGLGGLKQQKLNSLIKDSSVKNAILNSIKEDDTFSREDKIGILKSAGDNGHVSEQQLQDLRKFFHDPIAKENTRQDVRQLFKKVIFEDKSNKWYTGSDSKRDFLGNLKSGSSTQQLHLLIGKHYFGTDRPATLSSLKLSYRESKGTLFNGEPSRDDAKQGTASNCYLIAAMAGLAQKNKQSIKDAFQENGDGTWSVRIFKDGKADYVTVDRFLPTTEAGKFSFANEGQDVQSKNNVLWVALMEKAYAQSNESGGLGRGVEKSINKNERNGYFATEYGSEALALKQISNKSVTDSKEIEGITENEFIKLVNSKEIVTFGVPEEFESKQFEHPEPGWSEKLGSARAKHAYLVAKYDSASKRFELYNPWGVNHLKFTYEQLKKIQGTISYTHSVRKIA